MHYRKILAFSSALLLVVAGCSSPITDVNDLEQYYQQHNVYAEQDVLNYVRDSLAEARLELSRENNGLAISPDWKPKILTFQGPDFSIAVIDWAQNFEGNRNNLLGDGKGNWNYWCGITGQCQVDVFSQSHGVAKRILTVGGVPLQPKDFAFSSGGFFKFKIYNYDDRFDYPNLGEAEWLGCIEWPSACPERYVFDGQNLKQVRSF
jgi:hypothetical protein